MQRLKSAERQHQNLARAKQTAEIHVRFFVDEKKKADNAADELRVTLVEAERQCQISQKAKLCADEKCRRLTELMEKSEQTASETRKENNILTSKIATLQTGIEIFTDDQVKHEMTMLYHELEQWIFSHIADTVLIEPGTGPECNTQRLIQVQSSICGWIHQNFWSSFFVGFGPSYSQYMMSLDNAVVEKCKSREDSSKLYFSNQIRPSSHFSALAVWYELRWIHAPKTRIILSLRLHRLPNWVSSFQPRHWKKGMANGSAEGFDLAMY